jgi:hypothetical protein
MQQSLQREVAEAVGFILASVAFILMDDSLVLRRQRGQRTHLQRRQRSRQFRLHRVVAQDVRVLR